MQNGRRPWHEWFRTPMGLWQTTVFAILPTIAFFSRKWWVPLISEEPMDAKELARRYDYLTDHNEKQKIALQELLNA